MPFFSQNLRRWQLEMMISAYLSILEVFIFFYIFDLFSIAGGFLNADSFVEVCNFVRIRAMRYFSRHRLWVEVAMRGNK
jgi:hypothetical protein